MLKHPFQSNTCSHYWYCFCLHRLPFALCHMRVCVYVCVCLQFGTFFQHCCPTTDGVSMCFLSLSSSISSQRGSAARCCAFKEIFHNILLSHPWGGTVRVQTWLETGDHQHSLIFTTVCLKAISVTQQRAPQRCFLFCSFWREQILSSRLSAADINADDWRLKPGCCWFWQLKS